MKQINMFGLIILTFFSFLPLALAECSYEDQVKLATEAQNVRVVYEVIENTTNEQIDDYDYPYNDYIKMTIYNITENITVSITDDVIGGEDSLFLPVEKEIKYEDTNEGTYEFDVTIMNQVRNLKVVVSSQNENCSLKQERTEEIALPYFNVYYLLDGCKNSNDYYCQKYTNVDLNMSREEVEAAVSKPVKNEEETPDPVVAENNLWKLILIIGGGVIILGLLIGLIVTIHRLRQRRSVL